MDKKVLIVEDDLDIIDIIRGIVSDLCTGVDDATTLEDAVNLLNKNTYSLIFLDINLDFRSSEDIINLLDEMPENPNTKAPIVVVSGMVTPQFEKEYANRFAKVISKPFDEKELKEVARKLLK